MTRFPERHSRIVPWSGLSLLHLFPGRDSLYSICSLVGTLSTPSFPGRDSLYSICSQDGTLASSGSKEDASSSLWSWLRQSGDWQGPGAPWPSHGGAWQHWCTCGLCSLASWFLHSLSATESRAKFFISENRSALVQTESMSHSECHSKASALLSCGAKKLNSPRLSAIALTVS